MLLEPMLKNIYIPGNVQIVILKIFLLLCMATHRVCKCERTRSEKVKVSKQFADKEVNCSPKHLSLRTNQVPMKHYQSKFYTRRSGRFQEFRHSNLFSSPFMNLEATEVRRRRRSIQSLNENTNMRLQVRFQLQRPGLTNGRQEDFHQHLIRQLAKTMRVPIPSIRNVTIMSGSQVSFTLSAFNDENNIMDDQTVHEAADFLKAKIKAQQLQITDLNGELLMTARSVSLEEETWDITIVALIVLCFTLLMVAVLIITIGYTAKRLYSMPKASSDITNQTYRKCEFGRDSSQSVGKYSYDSGLWLGPGPEPAFSVPDAPFYRPPTVEQITSTPRPMTAVRTVLKRNWNIDERALSTIPDDYGKPHASRDSEPSHYID